MGTNALSTRSPGQTILQNFFNDFNSALEYDLVGRDTNGNPIAGNNLGNQAYPWGTAYLTSLLLDGVALSPSQFESDPYKVVSGATRSTSSMADFIRASGSSTNFTVKATAVPLVLQIAGVGATWTTDVTVAGTVAPSSNNTATVNNALFTGQTSSRLVGEYGSDALFGNPFPPEYGIQISSVGSAITALVGTWQAFKIGSEYFIGYVYNTTLIDICFRGFFLDNTGTPIPRSTISNGATITLMSLGWVFLDANGSTVDVTYTNPAYGYSAPSSPASGNYWFNQSTGLWNRYNGSSFVVVNRVLAGVAVLNSTECVASRSFNFWALSRADNTIEPFAFSTSVVMGGGLAQFISVNGQRIHFQTSPAVWNTASNVAASTERYNATIQASSVEYLYISDKGETWLSDMEPLFRADLLGWYHPFNTWRCVGSVATDGSANFLTVTPTAPTIPRNSIQRRQLPPVGQVSNTVSTWVNSTNADTTAVSQAFTPTTARPVMIMFQSIANSVASIVASVATAGTIVSAVCDVYRGTTLISSVEIVGAGASSASLTASIPPAGLNCMDLSPIAGVSSTYSLQVRSSTGTIEIENLEMIIWQL